MHAAAAKKASRASMGLFRLWTTDKGTFPVLFCAGVAAVGCTLTAVRAIRMSPDVRINKDKRRNSLGYSAEDGAEWRAKRFKYANYDRNAINQSKQYDDLFAKEENKGVAR